LSQYIFVSTNLSRHSGRFGKIVGKGQKFITASLGSCTYRTFLREDITLLTQNQYGIVATIPTETIPPYSDIPQIEVWLNNIGLYFQKDEGNKELLVKVDPLY
jgi:hypothetical protein